MSVPRHPKKRENPNSTDSSGIFQYIEKLNQTILVFIVHDLRLQKMATIRIKPKRIPMNQNQWETILGRQLPCTCNVQYGERFGCKIYWQEPCEETLTWKDKVNPDNEPGICIEDDGGWGYAGWNYKQKILERYSDEDGEHVLRIVN